MSGPLTGLRVLEMQAIGPVPWAGMMLADMGADVLRIDRPQGMELGMQGNPRLDITGRGKRTMAVDIKTAEGTAMVLEQVAEADVLLEGLRPGVMERLGLGPDACMARNPRLVYGRMTGWGQQGPRASGVGHDINYIAIAGALHAIGPSDGPPTVPLNLVGDFGGGGMLLLVGVLSALFERGRSGQGQVVDAAMVDGTLALMAPLLSQWQAGKWHNRRGSNVLDGGAPFYGTYATADGQAVAVGAIEARFYAALLKGLELDPATLPTQHDRSAWASMRARFAAIFASQPRAHWEDVFRDTDACVSPVLGWNELAADPHLKARGNFIDIDGVLHPAPAPRFSRTPGVIGNPDSGTQK